MKNIFVPLLAILFCGTYFPACAQAGKTDTLQTLLSYSAPGPSHAALGRLAGTWNFQDAKLSFVKGTLVREAMFEGRFYNVKITGGKLKIPVGGGAMKEENYQGAQLEGYDNVRKQYITTAVNNHIGSDIQIETGSYDAAKNTFTYTWESELLPGMKVTGSRVVTIKDADHYVELYFEVHDGRQVQVRQLDYTRAR